MNSIPGYALKEQLYRGRSTVVYRGIRLKDKAPVVVKALAGDYPSRGSIARLKNDFNISRRLLIKGVVRSYELINGSRGPVLIPEDFGGLTLRELLSTWRPNLQEALRFCEELARILHNIHVRGIVHKDVKPENIIVDPLTRGPALTDFGISALMSVATATESTNRTEGTIAYMAPEQTGRVNHPVDLRSDLYAVGVCLFELLTGEQPFRNQEPSELIHSHIAVRAPAPGSRRADVPGVVDEIVAKLLAKSPEDRYQSAHGLVADLRRCQEFLERGDSISGFAIAGQDRSVVPRFSQTLYGRTLERESLAAAFEEAAEGGNGVCLVSGKPGIGKSALIQSLRNSVYERQGYFVQGKFEQLKNARPYSAWLQAFRQLIKRIASESESDVAAWKKRLLREPGLNVGVVAALVPELEWIVGAHPTPVELAPADAQNRFALAFRQFVASIARRKHPLCVFLDDLQWADPESLRLLAELASDREIQSCLIVGAYRDNEDEARALAQNFEVMESRGARIRTIQLGALREADLQRMLADTLSVPFDRVVRLSSRISQKTGGNPFYAREFISSLFRDGVLHYAGSEGWKWDDDRIRSLGSTDNIVELMTGRIQHLSPDARRILEFAACIGSNFELKLLASISLQPESEIAEHLWEALVAGLIVFAGVDELAAFREEPARDAVYRFAHDRIQQTAYASLPSAERGLTHLSIGRELLRIANPTVYDREAEAGLFAIVNHFSVVPSGLLAKSEFFKLARLNLKAGEKARGASAFETAIRYFNQGIALLPSDAWETEYDLMFALTYQRYECEQLTADREQLLRSFEVLIRRARTDLERARIYNIKSVYYILQAEYREAVEAGLAALRFCGIFLPERPGRLRVLFALGLVKWRAYRIGLRNIPRLPVMDSENPGMAIELLSNLGGPLFQYSPNLYAMAIIKMFQITLRHGHTPITPMSLNLFAVIEGGALNNLRAARYLSLLSLRLNRRFPDVSVKSRARYMQAIFFSGYFEHTSKSIQHLSIANDAALSAGDFYALGYVHDNPAFLMLLNGSPLEDVHRQAESSLEFVSRLDYREGPDFILPYRQFVRALRGDTIGRGELSDADYREEEHYADMLANPNPLPLSFYYFIKIKLLYLYGRHADAYRTAAASEKVIEISTCLIYITVHYFYQALSAASLYPEASSVLERRRLRAIVRRNHRKFQNWSRLNPKNFHHQELLLRAERLRCSGSEASPEVGRLYDRAIDAARENSFIHHEAVASERAAIYYVRAGLLRVARPYSARARYLFIRWGAPEKARHIEEVFRDYGIDLDADAMRNASSGVTPSEEKLTFSTTAVSRFRRLDISTVLKAAESITGALRLEDLFYQLLRLAMEHAGASRGLLILETAGQAMIEASASVSTVSTGDGGGIEVRIERKTIGGEYAPVRILNFTIRSGETVILTDALNDPAFGSDEYVQERRIRSVLCVPVFNQEGRQMILYLENDLSAGVFSPKRLELLRVLSNLAVVALDNALIHDTLENRVRERTLELGVALEKEEELSEQLRFALERAEEAAELRARMTALISHEYRNPLTSIKSAAYLLGQYSERMTRGERKEKAAAIEEEVDHMESLLEDVLTLGRNTDIRLVSTDLAEFCSDTIRRLPGSERVITDYESADGALLTMLDRHLTHQIVSNLVTNAIKYSDLEVRVRVGRRAEIIELSVADRGIGIPEADQDRLFDAFFRAANVEVGTGHGLGLSIVKRAVEILEGRISVQSAPGQGSVFLVELPLRPPPSDSGGRSWL